MSYLRLNVIRVAIVAAIVLILTAQSARSTALDDYVNAKDDTFAYERLDDLTAEEETFTTYTYKMTSQKWLTEDKIAPAVWNHWVFVYVPKDLAHSDALILINGGGNPLGDAPDTELPLSQIAVGTKSILVSVSQIPNQRLKLSDEYDDRYKENGRKEDELIAYLWDKYLATEDPMWLPRLPMTKAVVRAMDLVQAEHEDVTGFVVTGASKRGWTTWTTAAVDKRVKAAIPLVIDVVNVIPSLDNHHDAYGFWAPATQDYVDTNVLDRNHTPEFGTLCKVVDPIHYVDRYTMPKYIINSAGDQFFTPDSWKFYFNDLEGEAYLRYVPNSDHGLNMGAVMDLSSFHHAIAHGTPRPKFTWTMDEEGGLHVDCETAPARVQLWQAVNPEARDFRLEEVGRIYKRTVMEPTEDHTYSVNPGAPEEGWTAFFIEMEFENPDFQYPFKFTTGVSILPDTYPHKGERGGGITGSAQ